MNSQFDNIVNDVDELFESAWQQRESAPQVSLAIIAEIEQKEDLKSTRKARCAVLRSFHYGRELRFRDAVDAGIQGLEILSVSDDMLWLCRAHGRLAVGLHSLGDLITANKGCRKQIEIAREAIAQQSCTSTAKQLFKDELLMAYHNLARYLFRVGELNRAQYYFKKCYSLTTPENYVLSFVLINHAQCNIAQSHLKIAQLQADNARKIAIRLKVDRVALYTLPVLADLAARAGDNTSAEIYLLEALEMAARLNLSPAQVKLNLAEHYLNTDQYNLASQMLKESPEITDVIDDAKHYRLQSELAEKTGNYKAALGYHKQYYEIQNRIFTLKKDDQAHAIAVAGKLRRLEANYSKLHRRNRLLNRDVQLAGQQHRKLKALAERDPLTNLYNRRQFVSVAEAKLETVQKTGQTASLAVIDVDKFKSINDQHGHQIGDKVLVTLASLFSNLLREEDAIARYGGEEFVVLMPLTPISAAEVVMQRLREAIMDYPWAKIQSGLSVTCSCGISQTGPGIQLNELFSQADKALYSAKNKGRNRVVLVEPQKETVKQTDFA